MKISKTVKDQINAISQETRLIIMLLLSKKAMYVSELKKAIKIEPTLLSHHLDILRKAKMIKKERHGKKVFCTKIPHYLPKELIQVFSR